MSAHIGKQLSKAFECVLCVFIVMNSDIQQSNDTDKHQHFPRQNLRYLKTMLTISLLSHIKVRDWPPQRNISQTLISYFNYLLNSC